MSVSSTGHGLLPNGHLPTERSSMNAWDSKEFVATMKQCGPKESLLAAPWSEACLAFHALEMLEEFMVFTKWRARQAGRDWSRMT